MDCSFFLFFFSSPFPLSSVFFFFSFAPFLISSGVKPIYRRIRGGGEGTFFSLVPVKPARLIKKQGTGGEKYVYPHADTHTRREKTGKLLLTATRIRPLFFFLFFSLFFFHLMPGYFAPSAVLGALPSVQRKVARKLEGKSDVCMWDKKKRKKKTTVWRKRELENLGLVKRPCGNYPARHF